MPKLTVVDRAGRERIVEAEVGLTVMEIIRDNGCGDLLALCGGCCSCATCHVYVERRSLDAMPSMGAEENDLLDGLEHRRPESRLACQIPYVMELDGAVVRIAPGN